MVAWDLVIYDRAPPKPQMPRTNTFFIACGRPAAPWKLKPEVALPQIIDAAVSHRLMQWVDTNEIQKVITATPLEVPAGGTVLIDSDKGPLLAIAPREAYEDLGGHGPGEEADESPTARGPRIAIPIGPGGRASPLLSTTSSSAAPARS